MNEEQTEGRRNPAKEAVNKVLRERELLEAAGFYVGDSTIGWEDGVSFRLFRIDRIEEVRQGIDTITVVTGGAERTTSFSDPETTAVVFGRLVQALDLADSKVESISDALTELFEEFGVYARTFFYVFRDHAKDLEPPQRSEELAALLGLPSERPDDV